MGKNIFTKYLFAFLCAYLLCAAAPAAQAQTAFSPLDFDATFGPKTDEQKERQKQTRLEREQQEQEAKIKAEQEAKTQEALRKEHQFNDVGRMLHPWYNFPEITGKELQKLPKPPWFGEELKFKIGWAFITAGEASLTLNKIVQTPQGPALVSEATARSYPVIDAMFKVRDTNTSWLALDLKKSFGYWQSVREGGYARDEWTVFDYDKNSYSVHKQDKRGLIDIEEANFKGKAILDMLGSLYFVRMQKLPLKGEIYFDIVNRKKQYPLKVIVHGKDKVKTAAGTFNCILVEPVIAGEGIFVSKGKSLKVWLTDDKYKMPVKMTVEVFIGSVKAELVEYKRPSPAAAR